MAAGENQPKAVVFYAFILQRRAVTDVAVKFFSDSPLRGVEPFMSSHGVDSFETARRNEPGSRIVGHAFLRPLIERGRESIVQPLLREIEIAQQADEGRENLA